MIKIGFFLTLMMLTTTMVFADSQNRETLRPYVESLKEQGEEPVRFILDKLDSYDLIIFDDALHTADEPFEFYRTLVTNAEFRNKAKYIFLELVSINQQPSLDAYFESEINDISLLYQAFQNDFSGTGLPFQSYFDLLQCIWEVNSGLSPDERIRVYAVNAPVYWLGIHTAKDLELFRLSLRGNDYIMYKTILSYLNHFRRDKKGIFLSNTRHAYKAVRDKAGEYYWNTGTFFHKHHPDKTYSVRFHNITLNILDLQEVNPDTPTTTEGLERIVFNWIRMEKGLWDSAFKEFGNSPIAIDLKDTPFGNAEYIGNHMLNVAPGQTMYDAYDGLIFLKPVDELHQTGIVDFIYTEEFKEEMERRFTILYNEDQIKGILEESGVLSIREYVDSMIRSVPRMIEPLTKEIGSIDEWKAKR